MSNALGLDLIDDRHPLEPYFRLIYRRTAGAFVDVGANTGRTLLAVAAIDPDIPYVGFEPLIDAAEYLRLLIERNGWDATHTVYPVALAEDTAAGEIRLNDAADCSASLSTTVRPPTMYARQRPVTVVPGDPFLRDAGPIAAIKIDAEGFEPHVLRGLQRTLAEHRPALVLEIMPYSHLEAGTFDRAYFGHPSPEEVERLIANRKRHMRSIAAELEAQRYSLFRLDPDAPACDRLRPARPEESTFEEQDFLALPDERIERWTAPTGA